MKDEAIIDEFLAEIKKDVRPSNEEVTSALTLYEELKAEIKGTIRLKEPYTVELEGSLAKGTALRGDIDLYIFILIRREDLSREWLEENVLDPLNERLGRKCRVSRRYASHPYLRVGCSGLEADLVPAFWAKSIDEIRTPVDRTPFHTRYVRSRLTEDMRDEVRLLKKFLKSLDIYGAEIRVQGFSGYLTELLIIKYKTFLNLLKEVPLWREGQVIFVEPVDEDESTLRSVFRDSSLIIPDPVDPRRNAAAAVSRKSLATLILGAAAFTERPSRDFFFPKKRFLTLEELDSLLRSTERKALTLIFIIRGEESPDVLWGELRRLASKVRNYLIMREYPVLDVRMWSDEERIAVILVDVPDPEKISAYVMREGPRRVYGLNIIKYAEKYVKMQKALGPWVSEEGVPKVLVPRKGRDPVVLLRETPPDFLAAKTLNPFKITADLNEVIRFVGEDRRDEFLHWLTEAVVKRPSWLGIDGWLPSARTLT
jgi:tRNA nucleotidyltransferase (CCA-adding enzyme)